LELILRFVTGGWAGRTVFAVISFANIVKFYA